MGSLQGKGIWTLYDDIQIAVNKAPEVGAKYILCKVSKGGIYDPQAAGTALAIVRKNPKLVPLAWVYSYLRSPQDEANGLALALRDGFEAVILDAEADLVNKLKQAEEFVKAVQALGIDTSRLYLCGDPRLDTKIDSIPYAVLSQVCRGGWMPLTYGELLPGDRKNAAERVIGSAYAQYERHKARLGYTIPLMPVISSHWDTGGKARMTQVELKRWCDEVQKRSASLVTLYRAGVVTTEAWTAFQKLQVSASEVIRVDVDTREASAALVQPGGVGYTVFAYPPHDPKAGWGEFTDANGYRAYYRKTVNAQTLYAQYFPDLKKAGRYLIEVFIPGQHATTRGAQYFVVHHEAKQPKEAHLTINQLETSNQWVSLGSYDLDPKLENSGRVNLVDQTSDTDARTIVFSAIRWTPVPAGGPGFDAPIGTEAERASPKIWPGDWVDANPYLNKYFAGYHTGADLNLNIPTYNLDKGKPVYAAADGTVIFSQVVTGSTWNGLIVIEHPPLPDGKPVFTRYGHVENLIVKAGDTVRRGQQIAQVGRYLDPRYPNYHLHFDVSLTTILKSNPRHWPKFDLNSVKTNYVDPKKFIEQHRP